MFYAVVMNQIDICTILLDIGGAHVDDVSSAVLEPPSSLPVSPASARQSPILAPSYFPRNMRFRQTPLLLASRFGFAELVKLLVTKGGKPEDADDDGETALHIAARNNQAKCLQILCASVASKDCLNQKEKIYGWTPSIVAGLSLFNAT
jgi:ankyrin repeat protein